MKLRVSKGREQRSRMIKASVKYGGKTRARMMTLKHPVLSLRHPRFKGVDLWAKTQKGDPIQQKMEKGPVCSA